ncbi:translationally-controlled tumor protein [Physcia stellaris]|nr:translationally-controlled tumor protein [Physcia stellaris]
MIIYKDIVTGDEIISDSYDMKEVDDTVYEVNCKKIVRGGDNFDIGANPSAEEQDEALEEGQKQVIDVVDAFRLNFYGDEESGTRALTSKKDFMSQFKGYLKKVIGKLKEGGADEAKIKDFQTKVQSYYTSKIAPNFQDFDFYLGESMDPDGMVILLNYREDGMTPYVTIWKDGLTEMKV